MGKARSSDAVREPTLSSDLIESLDKVGLAEGVGWVGKEQLLWPATPSFSIPDLSPILTP